MKTCFSHLTFADRRQSERWRQMKMSGDEMARRLGRHRSTVFRDLRRNRHHDAEIPELSGYWGLLAHETAQRRRFRRRKMVIHSDLRRRVATRLKSGWTPEQIAGRMRFERAPVRVSHETIYQHIYSPDGHVIDLYRHLPDHRRRRRGHERRCPQLQRFADELVICNRPEAVGSREEFGNWEGDLVLFRKEHGAANFTSLVERVSRYTVLLKNPDRRSRPVMNGIIESLVPLPFHCRRSITFDRGLEFLAWPHLQAGVGVAVWFCDPRSPWQKGTVENDPRPHPPLAAPRDRSERSHATPAGGHLRASRQRTAQVPGLSNPRRSLPREDHQPRISDGTPVTPSEVACRRARPGYC